jgi:RHS repeat-associated protein
VLPPAGARTTYAWDPENRLTSVLLPSGARNTFAYNGDGGRVRHDDAAGTARLVWDGANVLAETDAGGTTQAEYTLAPEGYGAVLSQRRGAASRFFHFDGLGSADRLSDSSGAVTDSYLYDAYGTPRASSGTTSNRWRFGGRWGYALDADLLSYWLRAREYDPALARFLSADPLGVEFSLGANLYAYAGDWPTLFVDPSGLFTGTSPWVPPVSPVAPPTVPSIGVAPAAARVPLLARILPPVAAAVTIATATKVASDRVNCAYIVRAFCKPQYELNKAEARALAVQCGSSQCRGRFRQPVAASRAQCIERIEAMYLLRVAEWYEQCIRSCGRVPISPDYSCNVGMCEDLCCEEEKQYACCCLIHVRKSDLKYHGMKTKAQCQQYAITSQNSCDSYTDDTCITIVT